MLIGNTEAKDLLQKYILQYTSGAANNAGFFLLHWPSNVGKSSIVHEMIQSLLWEYIQSNLLHIKDFSEALGKNHSIKIEEDQNEDFKTLRDEHAYNDIWVREINLWLQKSGFWFTKVLLIENIERMTTGAINAFLKTCEEPLANRLIIATTSNKNKLLDTVISRAISIPFVELSDQEIAWFAKENDVFSDNPALQDVLVSMSMWRPGTLMSFHRILSQDDVLKEEIHQITNILSKPGNIHQKQIILNKFTENGILWQFLDWWIAYTTNNNLVTQAKKRLKIKKMLQTNVAVENVILYWLLD